MAEFIDETGSPRDRAATKASGRRRQNSFALCAAFVLSVTAAPSVAQFAQDADYDLWAEDPPAKVWNREVLTPMHSQRTERHKTFIQRGVPVEYLNQSSPYPKARAVIKEGSKVYAKHCIACHGPRGMGDGEAGKDLAPSPALLAYLEKEPQTADSYLLWTITEGGKPFGTEMPAFKDLLSEREIWQVVIYMRAGFPETP